VPADIAGGVKKGFSAPDASWFRGDSIDYVTRTLMCGNARIFEWLDRTAVQHLIKDHLEGRENRRLLIWSLLTLEEWLKHLADGNWGVRAESQAELHANTGQ
jgi:asparagine synthase (glutamine-hydrolysing)